jgi:hypothetical protein
MTRALAPLKWPSLRMISIETKIFPVFLLLAFDANAFFLEKLLLVYANPLANDKS